VDAYVSLGGGSVGALASALAGFADVSETSIVDVSDAYAPAWGGDAAIAVARVRTALDALALSEWLDEVARRASAGPGDGAVHVQVILFGDEEWSSPKLTLPSRQVMAGEPVAAVLLALEPRATLPDRRLLADAVRPVGGAPERLGPVPGFEPAGTPIGELATAGESAEPGSGDGGGAESSAGLVSDGGAGDRAAAAVDWDHVYAMERTSGEWVPVVTGSQLSPEMQILLGKLIDSGIPAAMNYDPGISRMPWGIMAPVKILVPPPRVAEARAVLSAHVDAPEFVRAGIELAQMRQEIAENGKPVLVWGRFLLMGGLIVAVALIVGLYQLALALLGR
jgi:7,8-dihydro-6-hydroxymethylpterin-pyrophosphokinase